MELAYRQYGEGRPLIVLHGLFGQNDNWNTLAKQFGENGQQVFAVDQRNHGQSPHTGTHTFEEMADDLAGFIKQHGLEKPCLLGHSMGGKTVLFFEKRFPSVAGKIIIADIATRNYKQHHDGILDALNSVDLQKITSRGDADKMLAGSIPHQGTRQFLLKNLYWKNGKLAWRFNLEVLTRDYANVTAEVPFFTSDVPALIIRGEKSSYVQEDDITDFKKRFSSCAVTTIKDAGHWLHAEKPEPFFETVMAFIRS